MMSFFIRTSDVRLVGFMFETMSKEHIRQKELTYEWLVTLTEEEIKDLEDFLLEERIDYNKEVVFQDGYVDVSYMTE